MPGTRRQWVNERRKGGSLEALVEAARQADPEMRRAEQEALKTLYRSLELTRDMRTPAEHRKQMAAAPRVIRESYRPTRKRRARYVASESTGGRAGYAGPPRLIDGASREEVAEFYRRPWSSSPMLNMLYGLAIHRSSGEF